ncbi:MAG: flagellar filament capping protein FliD, partial [Armatimonadetes bacterium]|nr:flagellar filament capping protein FliD [Armatimonadota bacterium]
MAGTASISGIISGLKTDDIIAKMMELAAAPVTRLEARKTALSAKITAWQEMNTRILALKTKAYALANPLTFQTKDLTTSDSDILTGSASSTAQAGTYFIKVNATAKTHQLKTQGFADINSTTIGTGTVTVGAGSAGRTATNLLAGTVESVTLATNTTLTTGSQTLVIDAVGTSATREMTATYAGADEAAARAQDAGAAGTITVNGVDLAFDDSDTVGEVVDAINARTGDTGVVASITGSADDWHVTLTQQTHGSNKEVVYAETAGILNGGAGNDYTVAGTDAAAHIGSLLFNSGLGDTLQSANGDIIVLNSDATAGTKDNAFEIVGASSITVSSTNNTLAGLRDAINAASAGVTASIINDGSGTAPYRLIITSNTGGAAGQITLNADGLSGGTTPTFSTMQAAQDASLTLGEGAGAITITKGSNTITDLISGVTLNLKSADANTTVTVEIKSNTSAAKQAVKDFVEQYNNLIDYIGPQFQYNATTNTAGTLFADSRLRSILSDLRSKISNPISGLSQTIKVMSQIGITSTTNDKLQIDETQLDNALANNLSSVKK